MLRNSRVHARRGTVHILAHALRATKAHRKRASTQQSAWRQRRHTALCVRVAGQPRTIGTFRVKLGAALPTAGALGPLKRFGR